MARLRVVAVLVTVAMSIASCTQGADPGGDSALGETVVDTIGDTIVVRTVNARDDEAGLRLTPEITIGVVDGAEEYQFTSVAEMVPAADGTAYVWDRTLGVLRQYDPSGRFVRVIGGQGGGPGEYRSSNGIALLPGGRLVLWDAQQARVNVYDTSGTHITTWRAASPAMGPRGVYVDTAGALYLRTPLREPRLPDAAGSQETGLVEVDAGTGTPIRFLRAPTSATSAPRIAVMRADGRPCSGTSHSGRSSDGVGARMATSSPPPAIGMRLPSSASKVRCGSSATSRPCAWIRMSGRTSRSV